MFDFEDGIEVSMPMRDFYRTFTAYDFSIFFNLFVNLLTLKSELMRNQGMKHMHAMSFVMLHLACKLIQFPVFAQLQNLFDLQALKDSLKAH